MEVIRCINVNDAYRRGIEFLWLNGLEDDSRNGPVRVHPEPVTTRYTHPRQRVLFDAQRDANPFFHLFEAMWMLAGRNDLKTLTLFLPNFEQFSDDGETLHGAYGHRWRHFPNSMNPLADTALRGVEIDQLDEIVEVLRKGPKNRQAMLQMWDVTRDLNVQSKDIPCNDLVKFRVIGEHKLDMYVFCRSNDIIYGAYGANAVQFSFLQEYMASRLQLQVGAYEQISCDYHAYVERPYKWSTYWPLRDQAKPWINPYLNDELFVHPLMHNPDSFDAELNAMVDGLANGNFAGLVLDGWDNTFFKNICQPMYRAHRIYKDKKPALAANYLSEHCMDLAIKYDWLEAGIHWLIRRAKKLHGTHDAAVSQYPFGVL